MEELNFKMEGFWYHIWRFTYGAYTHPYAKIPPNDTCTYRGQLIIASIVALAFLPFTIVRFIYLWVRQSFDYSDTWLRNLGIIGHILSSFILFISAATGKALMNITNIADYKWYYIIYGFILFIVIVTSIVGLVLGIERLYDLFIAYRRKNKKKTEEVKPDGTIKTLYKSWRDKYCIPIKWKIDGNNRW